MRARCCHGRASTVTMARSSYCSCPPKACCNTIAGSIGPHTAPINCLLLADKISGSLLGLVPEIEPGRLLSPVSGKALGSFNFRATNCARNSFAVCSDLTLYFTFEMEVLRAAARFSQRPAVVSEGVTCRWMTNAFMSHACRSHSTHGAVLHVIYPILPC